MSRPSRPYLTPRDTDREAYRPGAGSVMGVVECPTVDIPSTCCCSWRVVRAGTGRDCVSLLVHMSTACPSYLAHRRAAEKSRLTLVSGGAR